MTHTAPTPRVAPPVIELRGRIATDLAEYARGKVLRALERGVDPVGPARVRVVRHDDPGRERPVVASVHVDLGGRRLHAHVVAEAPREAVDVLVDRLRRQVLDAHTVRRLRRAGRPAGDPGAGGHGDGVIARHDVVQAVPTSVGDAVAIMEDRREAFYLFVERTTRRRAVVYPGGPTGRRLALDDGSAPALPAPDGVTVGSRPARVTGPERAVEHLRLAGLPFLFFHDPGARRARVVHLDERGRAVLVDVDVDGDVDEDAGTADGGPGAER